MPWMKRGEIELYYERHAAYDEDGRPPIVLGHSFLCSTEMWSPLLDTLRARHTVISVDLRGHGRSGRVLRRHDLDDLAADVLGVLDHLGLPRAILGGLSIGGMSAMRVAARAPERVAGLVLINTDCAPERRTKVLEYRALGALAHRAPLRLLAPRIAAKMFGRSSFARRPDLVDEWKSRWERIDVQSTLHVLDALVSRGDARPLLGRIRAPTLVIHGTEDAAIPRARCQEVADLIPGAAWATVDGAGHLLTLERPEALFAMVGAFLERVPRATSAE